MQRVSRMILIGLALAGLSAPATPLSVRYVAHGGWDAEETAERHPKRYDAVLVVPVDLVDPTPRIEVSYGRTSSRRPDRGRVLVDLQIARDTDGDGAIDSTEEIQLVGNVRQQRALMSIGPIAPVRTGDLLTLRARFRQMPRIDARRGAWLTLYLRSD